MVEYHTLSLLESIRLVPVVVLNELSKSVPLAQALFKGGIPIAEVTLRTPCALECIRQITASAPEILVGAGTVHSAQDAAQAVKNGAKFIVTAGFNEPVVDWCLEHGIDVFPGCVTPSELERVLLKGLTVAKFFPAEVYGGVKALIAFAGPYREMRFIPTGGISPENLPDYLRVPSVLACGGAWMVPEKQIAAGEFNQITALCKTAVGLTGDGSNRTGNTRS